MEPMTALQTTRSIRLRLAACLLLSLVYPYANPSALADSGRDGRAALAAEIESVVNRPEYKLAQFGILFVDMDSGKTVYELNADKLFKPASTTKLYSVATALDAYGAGHRFKT